MRALGLDHDAERVHRGEEQLVRDEVLHLTGKVHKGAPPLGHRARTAFEHQFALDLDGAHRRKVPLPKQRADRECELAALASKPPAAHISSRAADGRAGRPPPAPPVANSAPMPSAAGRRAAPSAPARRRRIGAGDAVRREGAFAAHSSPRCVARPRAHAAIMAGVHWPTPIRLAWYSDSCSPAHVAARQKVVLPTPPKPTTMQRTRETACGSAASIRK